MVDRSRKFIQLELHNSGNLVFAPEIAGIMERYSTVSRLVFIKKIKLQKSTVLKNHNPGRVAIA